MKNFNISKFSISSVAYTRKAFCKWMKLKQTSFPMEIITRVIFYIAAGIVR